MNHDFMKLADICKINPRAELLDDVTPVSFVGMSDVSEDGKLDAGNIRRCGELKNGFTSFKEGDVLFAKITPCMENGKGALAVGLMNGIGYGSTEFHVLRPKKDLALGKWLYYLTSWPGFRTTAALHMTGSAGQKRVPKTFLESYELTVPSTEIQSRQVSTLDRIRRVVDSRRAQLAALDELVKARFVEMFGDPVTNSKHLPVSPLSELGALERGRSKHRPRNDPKLLNGPYPLIQTGEVAAANVYLTTYQNTYSELGLQQSKLWKAGTLCITIAANIAQTAILTFDACFPDSVVGFVPNDKIDALYMHYWFGFFQKILEEQAPQVAQKNINLKILSELQVVLPDAQQRKQFTAFVSRVERAKTTIRHSLAETQTLFDSLMQEYFGKEHNYA